MAIMKKQYQQDSYRPQFNRPSYGERTERRMFRATCAECGRECEVPFKPTGERPIYCSNCYERQQSESGPRNYSDRKPVWNNRNERAFGDRGFGERKPKENSNWQQLAAIESKLDKILSLLGANPEENKSEVAETKKPLKKKTKKEIVVG
jgi:CxxC-x17-CxxC domain-containing protein